MNSLQIFSAIKAATYLEKQGNNLRRPQNRCDCVNTLADPVWRTATLDRYGKTGLLMGTNIIEKGLATV